MAREPDVPLWIFWMGGELTGNRSRSLSAWKSLGFNLRFLSESDIYEMEKTGTIELHPGFQYLTATHKSDYLRSRIMYHFGGLYSDLKPPPDGIVRRMNKAVKSGIEFAGYKEVSVRGVPTECEESVRKKWRKLAGNTHFYFKPGHEFALTWMQRVDGILDIKMGDLANREHRGLGREPIRNGSLIESYPIRWPEIQGEVFQPLQAEFGFPARLTLPRPVLKDYL